MTPTIILLIWLLVIFAKQILNWHKIEVRKLKIKHGVELLIVAIACFFHIGWIAGVRRPDMWELGLHVLLFDAMAFWAFFDAGLNLMRGRELFYFSKSPGAAWTDRLFQRAGYGTYVMSKIFALVLAVYAAVQIFKLWN